MELVIGTKYTIRAQVTWGRLPETTFYRVLIAEGELLPLQIADIAARFGLQEPDHTRLLLHGDNLGAIAVVPLACDAYAHNAQASHAAVEGADYLLYLDGTRWAYGEYELLVLRADATPFRDREHPPTWYDLALYITNETAVARDAS